MVKTLQKFLLLFSLLCAAFSLQAQGATINITTFEDTPVSYTILSRNTPFITQLPQNGSLTVAPGPLTFQYVLTYTPDPGYLGLNDQGRVLSFPLQTTSFTISVFNFRVVAVELDANHDIAYTVTNAPVSVPVLANDYSSSGFLELRATPVANGGTASIDGNNLIFQPAEGFSGLTEVNYLVCTTNDICAMGTVSINVLNNDLSATQDTTIVFTKQRKPQFILAPNNYLPVNDPIHGSYGLQNGVITYTPQANFVGVEYLNFSGSSGDLITFAVEVLDMKDQAFSKDDLAYTLVGKSVNVNVLSNDYYGSFTGCITYQSPLFGSLSPGLSPGRITYTPPSGWRGVDRFTYRSYEPGCPGEGELATVYIIVDDFAPAQEALTITTTAGAPTQLTYAVPTGSASWSVSTQPSAGEVSQQNGQLIYTATASEGADYLAITYCLEGDTGGCEVSKTVGVTININPNNAAVSCNDDCVWPGDTNNDGVVNLDDFLAIGLYMGATGTPRLTAAPSMWCPQDAEDWEESTAAGVNFKHLDANGDQIVSALDTQVVLANLGLVHSLQPNAVNTASFDIILDGDIFAEPGDLLAIDVLVGTNLVGVEDVYGFRFPFPYDPSIFDPQSINLAFNENSWLSYASPVISTQVNRPDENIFEAAYIRTSGKPISGYGQVGTLYVGVEDVYGFRGRPDEVITATIGGQDAAALGNTGDMQTVRVQPLDITIRSAAASPIIEGAAIEHYLNEKLLAFPNPSTGRLTVHLNGQRTFNELSLVDITGRTLLQQSDLYSNHQVLDLSALPNGIYLLTITTNEGVVNRKIEIVR